MQAHLLRAGELEFWRECKEYNGDNVMEALQVVETMRFGFERGLKRVHELESS